MKTLSAVFALVVAVPSSAGVALPAADRVAALAAQAGLALPPAAAFEAPAFAPVKGAAVRVSAAAPAATSGWVSGSGYVRGNGSLHCSEWNGGHGNMSGWIRFDGDVPVNGPDGSRGTVRVDGTAHVSGSCRNGSGHVSGSVSLSGSGTLYKDGRPVGRASVSGHAFVSQFVNGPFAWFNEHVTVSGPFTAD
ncbi:MAG: hypothetical protein SF051_01855 [Elusimicrobiota bacterium]|nr:hypothetical protein [Elusimicrobiota bacterium]